MKFSIILLVVLVGCNSSSLQNGEVVKMNYSFSGCFGSSKASLSIIQKGNTFIAHLNEDGKSQRRELNSKVMDSLNSYINKLKKIKDSDNCTTVETYDVWRRSEHFTVIDGSCDYNIYDKMKSILLK